MSSFFLANKRTLIGRSGSSLRSQNKRPFLKESDIFIESILIPATGAEKVLSNAAK